MTKKELAARVAALEAQVALLQGQLAMRPIVIRTDPIYPPIYPPHPTTGPWTITYDTKTASGGAVHLTSINGKAVA